MNKSESKFYNTALKMHDALFTLLNQKEFTDISIMEICKLAGINRSTFYSHYQNTFELVQDAGNELINKFLSSFNFESDIASETDGSYFINEKYLIPYLTFFKENMKFYQIYMNHISLFNPNKMYELILKSTIFPNLTKHNIKDFNIANYIAKYYLNGINAIVCEWISNNCVDDIMLICEIIQLCVIKVDNK